MVLQNFDTDDWKLKECRDCGGRFVNLVCTNNNFFKYSQFPFSISTQLSVFNWLLLFRQHDNKWVGNDDSSGFLCWNRVISFSILVVLDDGSRKWWNPCAVLWAISCHVPSAPWLTIDRVWLVFKIWGLEHQSTESFVANSEIAFRWYYYYYLRRFIKFWK